MAELFHMRNIGTDNDAYVLANNLVEAVKLYEKSYTMPPDYILRLDGNISKLLMKVEAV